MTMQPSVASKQASIGRSKNRRRRSCHLLLLCNLSLWSCLSFWLSCRLLNRNISPQMAKRVKLKEEIYLLGSNLLLGLLYCTVDFLLCLLDNLLGLGDWALLGRSRLCDASRSNSLGTWLRCVGLGGFLWSSRLCDGLDLAWDGDAGLRSGLGASGGGRSHFVGFVGTLLVKYESCTIGDCISEVNQAGKCGCCYAPSVSFWQ